MIEYVCICAKKLSVLRYKKDFTYLKYHTHVQGVLKFCFKGMEYIFSDLVCAQITRFVQGTQGVKLNIYRVTYVLSVLFHHMQGDNDAAANYICCFQFLFFIGS